MIETPVIPTIDDPAEITAAWLTAALRAGGHLDSATVDAVAVERWRAKPLATLFRLTTTYSGGAELPRAFILKLGRGDRVSALATQRRWKEHQFYTQVAAAMPNPPVPGMFAASFDPETGNSLLLLADLTATHTAPLSPLPPSREQLAGAVDCLAAIHAPWWNHPDFTGATTERDETWIAQRTATTARRLHRFLAAFGAHLPAPSREALATVAAAWPVILCRSAAHPLTVVHGDAHPWNFLSPLAPADHTLLLDWEGWSIEPGLHDLASLLALHLPVDDRRASEAPLLARYANGLRARGIQEDRLGSWYDDYRLAVARRVLTPVGLWSRGSRARVWWSVLEHVTAAFYDLHCADLLAPR